MTARLPADGSKELRSKKASFPRISSRRSSGLRCLLFRLRSHSQNQLQTRPDSAPSDLRVHLRACLLLGRATALRLWGLTIGPATRASLGAAALNRAMNIACRRAALPVVVQRLLL